MPDFLFPYFSSTALSEHFQLFSLNLTAYSMQ